MSDIFNRMCGEYDSWYDRNQFVYLSELEAVRGVIPSIGTGIEIGVGTGRFAGPLGIEYGIDPSENMLNLAAKRGISIQMAFGESIPFEDKTFHYAAIIVTLCFVKNPFKVLQETHRVLKDSGRIIVGIVPRDSFLGMQYQQKKTGFYKNAQLFSVKEITGLLSSVGFERFRFYQTLFHPLTEIKTIEESRQGYGQGGFVVITAHARHFPEGNNN